MKRIIYIVIFGSLTLFFSCESEQLPVPDNTLPTNVSFTSQVIPIFNKSCNNSGCHNSGGIPPDLSAGNAYNSMIFGGQINLSNPDQSLIYKRMIKDMPPGGLVPQEEKNIVLGWITEGAKNN